MVDGEQEQVMTKMEVRGRAGERRPISAAERVAATRMNRAAIVAKNEGGLFFFFHYLVYRNRDKASKKGRSEADSCGRSVMKEKKKEAIVGKKKKADSLKKRDIA